jgi:ATP-dependent protease ClpP protease subunit
MMIHQPLGGAEGASDIQIQAKELNRAKNFWMISRYITQGSP